MSKGIWYAIGAYGIWGLFPIYWKWLQHVPALQLICHRIVWSSFILLAGIGVSRQWDGFRATLLNRRVLGFYSLAAVLISVNWFTYVWAVIAGFVVETSLGYFITPLVNMLLGVIVLRERPRPWQWAAIGLAAAGVLYLTLAYGALPWIALTLAFSFGTYGLVKKKAPLNAVHGLAMETGILLLPALLYLLAVDRAGQGAFLHAGLASDVLLVGAGVVTTIPLLLFASAARRIPLSLMGVFQYIAPTVQFLLGVLVYAEPFTSSQLVGFGIVWVALILFAVDGFLARRSRSAPSAG